MSAPVRSLLVAALALAAVAVEAPSAQAAGGVYNVVKCHPWHLEADEIQEAGGHPSYGHDQQVQRHASRTDTSGSTTSGPRETRPTSS